MTALPKWTLDATLALFKKPFFDLIFEAQTIHRQHFDPTEIQVSRLLSLKTDRCSEDCSYCAQSIRYKTNIQPEKLINLSEIIEKAHKAKMEGASRFCMGAAWRGLKKRHVPYITEAISEVKKLGLETCVTLGFLDDEVAQELADAGLDYYNHNLNTSPEFYKKIATTHTYQDRVETLTRVRKAGIKVCSGGIIGLGESLQDRAIFLTELANMNPAPESVPINRLIPIEGTPLEGNTPVDNLDFVRIIAIARIMMPTSIVRLSAGRETMSPELQSLCFLAGANSIFSGEKLLTAPNANLDDDNKLLQKIGLKAVMNPLIKDLTTATSHQEKAKESTISPNEISKNSPTASLYTTN